MCFKPSANAGQEPMRERYAAWAARWRVPLGFGLGVTFLVFSRPTFRLLLVGGAIALAGLVLRCYAAGYLQKNESLATAGPYTYTRNPLYLGSLFLGAGFALAGGLWFFGLAFAILFLTIYLPVMRREEQYLRQKFGATYDAYAREVALFFPLCRGSRPHDGAFSWHTYCRNREYRAALGFLLVIAFLTVKIWLQ